jgi:hypothetical protein
MSDQPNAASLVRRLRALRESPVPSPTKSIVVNRHVKAALDRDEHDNIPESLSQYSSFSSFSSWTRSP